MLSNYHTLLYIASSLDSKLKGGTLSEIFSQNRNEVVFLFDTGILALVMLFQAPLNTCYLRPGFQRAKKNSADIMRASWGATVDGISIEPSDRVLVVRLSSGYALSAQFFGAKSNVLLLDNNGKVIEAFKRAKHVVGGHYQGRTDALVYDLELLRAALEAEKSSPISAVLRNTFPTLGSTVVHELLYRSGIPPASIPRDPVRHTYDRLQDALRTILSELSVPLPRVYINGEGVPVAFSIIDLQHLHGMREQRFHDVHEAIHTFVARQQAVTTFDSERNMLLSNVIRQIERSSRTRDAIEQDIKETQRADDYERLGSLLMGNLASAVKGSKTVELRDGILTVVIPLHEHLTPVQNAQRYFERAKRSRIARKEAIDRLDALKERLRTGEELRHILETVQRKEELTQAMATHAEKFETFGIGKRSKARAELPFRVFKVDGGFEVWAGKSSLNNDLLTLKHAKPNDLWFHARGSGGSHVVLRVGTGRGEPGKKAKAQAAGIAAFYSKMKNATMVPVAMTERKYVRKPKGAPPGTVVLEREKVIFAEPGLPDGKEL